MKLEFFFDVGSPYSYLAATQVEALCADAGAELQWRPFLLGGVFKATGNAPPAALAPRGRYMLKDLHRWSAYYRVPFRFPNGLFPLNTLLPMRVLAGLPEAAVPGAALRLFAAYWVDNRDISQPEVVADLLGAEVLALAEDAEVKARLRATTEEAVARGAFGAPSLFVGDALYFGNDRLPFVEQALRA